MRDIEAEFKKRLAEQKLKKELENITRTEKLAEEPSEQAQFPSLLSPSQSVPQPQYLREEPSGGLFGLLGKFGVKEKTPTPTRRQEGALPSIGEIYLVGSDPRKSLPRNILELMLDPTEVAMNVLTGGVIGAIKGGGKEITKEALRWGSYGGRDLYKGLKEGSIAFKEALGAKAKETLIPAERAMPITAEETSKLMSIAPGTKVAAETAQETVEKLNKLDPKYKAPWGGRFEPREFDRLSDAERRQIILDRAKELTPKTEKEVLGYTEKLQKQLQRPQETITGTKSWYELEYSKLQKDNSQLLSKANSDLITPDDKLRSTKLTKLGESDLNTASINKTLESQEFDIVKLSQKLKNKGFLDPNFPDTKDFRRAYRFLQLPSDISKSFPKFKPIYETAREFEANKGALIQKYYETTKSYFDLISPADRAAVDKALSLGDKLKATLDDSILTKLNMTPKQIGAYKDIRRGLSMVKDDLAQSMQKIGVPQDKIDEFVRGIEGYVPHKWYGKYGVIVQEKHLTWPTVQGERVTGLPKERSKTIYLSAFENEKRAKAEVIRLQELYPDKIVKQIKRDVIPEYAKEDIAPYAIESLIDRAVNRAKIDPDLAHGLAQTLHNMNLSKGMGAHFIRRKWTPGYIENFERPLAEYFTGMSSYLSKIDALHNFSAGYKAIDKTAQPSLRKYASEYIDSIFDPKMSSTVTAIKTLLFHYHLGLNLKSALVNSSQNFISGYPTLSKYTNNALPKMIKAMFDTATKNLSPDEVEMLRYAYQNRLLESRLLPEVTGVKDPFLRSMQTPVGKKLMDASDISSYMFDYVESNINRTSHYLASYRALRDKGRGGAPGSTPELAKQAADMMLEAHYVYGPADRPVAARGWISPIMTFRLFGLNYATMLKNFAKEGEYGALARSLGAITAIAGAAGWPGAEVLEDVYMHFTGDSIKEQTRNYLKGITTSIFPSEWSDRFALAATDGWPAVGGLNFSGSIGMGDIIPMDLTGALGVLAGRSEGLAKAYKLATLGDLPRASENILPQAISSPLTALRAHKGLTTTTGQEVIDPKTLSQVKLSLPGAILRGVGIQPTEYTEAQRRLQLTNVRRERAKEIGLSKAEKAAYMINTGDIGKGVKILTELGTTDPYAFMWARNALPNFIGPKVSPVIQDYIQRTLYDSGKFPNMP